MQITRAADYAVRVMVHLASLPPGTRVQKNALVELSEAPQSFLSKVLQRMVARDLITSRRGSGGGFELAGSAHQVSVLNVVEAIDGPIHLNLCVPGASGCERSLACAVHPVWVEAREALAKVLSKATMAKLARDAEAHKNLTAQKRRNLPKMFTICIADRSGAPATAARRR
jgi:Rrf2 family protein